MPPQKRWLCQPSRTLSQPRQAGNGDGSVEKKLAANLGERCKATVSSFPCDLASYRAWGPTKCIPAVCHSAIYTLYRATTLGEQDRVLEASRHVIGVAPPCEHDSGQNAAT